jgi:hypothetical protein
VDEKLMIQSSYSGNIPQHSCEVLMLAKTFIHFWLFVLILLPEVFAQQASTGKSEFEKQLQAAHDAFAAGKYSSAFDAFKKASKLQDGCARCFLGMGDSALKTGDANGAGKSAIQGFHLCHI